MELEEELRVVANNLKSLEVEHEHNFSYLEPQNLRKGSNFPYLIFVIFSPRALFFAKFFKTQK